MSSIPAEISTPWHDLLKHRVLLHQTKKAVDDFDEFAKLFESPRLDDQNRAAALESYASRTFNLVIDLTKALLTSRAPDDSSIIKTMDARDVLAVASKQRIYLQAQWDVLDELRLGRNDLQHGSSFVAGGQVWRFIRLMEDSVDKVMTSLQLGFSQVGFELEMDFPPEFLSESPRTRH
jgi:hypothetical protein